MRVYTQEEAVLQAWKKELQTVETKKYIKLRDELLKLINDEGSDLHRYSLFYAKVQTLIQDNHDQDWSWNNPLMPFFNWLRGILPSFLSQYLPRESRLLTLLRTFKTPDAPLPISEAILAKKFAAPKLDQNQFEELLFSHPKEAVYRVAAHIQYLSKQQPKWILNDHLMETLERLYAIKNLLTPFFYLSLCKQLYNKMPTLVTVFFYQRYLADPARDSTSALEYVELHCLADGLGQLLVNQFSSSSQLYHGIELLLLLSLKPTLYNQVKKEALLLNDQAIESDESNPIIYLVNHGDSPSKLCEFITSPLLALIETKNPSHKNKRRSQNSISFASKEEKYTESMFSMLNDIYTYNVVDEGPDLLIQHVAWQFCEKIFSHFRSPNKAEQSAYYNKTAEFITLHLLKNPNYSKANSFFSDYTLQEKILNPHSFRPAFMPLVFANAERLATRFSLAASEGIDRLLLSIRRYHCEETDNRQPDDWHHTLKWIMFRLPSYIKDDVNLISQVMYPLHQPLVFGMSDWEQRVETPVTLFPLNQLINELQIELDNAHTELKRGDLGKEKEAIESFLTVLYYFLNHPDIKMDHLQLILSNHLPKLHSYFTMELINELTKYILTRNKQLLTITFVEDSDTLFEDAWAAKDALTQTEYCLQQISSLSDTSPQDLSAISSFYLTAIRSFITYMHYIGCKAITPTFSAKRIFEQLREILSPEAIQKWEQLSSIDHASVSIYKDKRFVLPRENNERVLNANTSNSNTHTPT